ncbi:MAG: ABC transporter substrate-binding protein [Thermodesulfobacteria bacterium]|nr:ABC transporter substrate-binding protein [Thermodesulfobacteriota bacterium]
MKKPNLSGYLTLTTCLFFLVCLRPVWALATSLMPIEFSVNFSLRHLAPGISLLEVKNPWSGAKDGFCYLLMDREKRLATEQAPKGYENCTVIKVPVKSMVVLSSTYYAFIDALGGTRFIVGASSPWKANTRSIREGFEEGHIEDVGQGLNVNVETLLKLMPEVVFTYATGGFRDVHPKLQEAGLKVVVCAEYMEEHPLGRAEWIKFFGLFLKNQKEAARLFEKTKNTYLHLAQRARNSETKPLVITNTPFAGRWFVPGGKSFVARLIQDAGATYVFQDIPAAGSIPMDIELVYFRGKGASFWINTGTWQCLEDVERTDPRFTDFISVKGQRLYNNNRRVNSQGGNDYWESGVMRPDRILADLISIFHWKLLPHHNLYYYRRLPAHCQQALPSPRGRNPSSPKARGSIHQ